MIEYDHQVIRTPRTEYRAPSVIRLQHLIRRPRPRVKLSRREVFARDRHTCQYCGRQAHDLTLDHVVPRHRGGGHTWENLVDRVQAVQPPQGRQDARGGPAAARCGRRSSRAATSTRCSRRTSPTSATRRGGRTCSWGGTDDRRPLEATIAGGHPGRRCATCSRTLWAAGHAAYVVGGSLRDVAARARPRHDWDLATDALPERVLELFPGRRLREPVRDGGGPAATARSSRSRRSAPTTTTPTSAGRIGSSSATRSSSTSRAATSRSTRWPGGRAPRRRTRPGSSIRTAASPTSRPRVLRAVGDPRAGSRRTRCGWSAPSGWRPTLGFEVEPATLAGIRAQAELVAPPVGRADRDRARQAARRGAAVDRPAAAGRHGPAGAASRRSSPRSAASPRTRSRARTCGTTRCGPSMRRRSAGRSSGSPRCSTTSASRRPSPTATSSATTRSGPSWPATFLERLRSPRVVRERVVHLVRNHMFSYEPNWSDAAVRRFIAKIGGPRPRRSRSCSRCARPTTSGPGCRPSAGRPRRAARPRRRGAAEGVALDRRDLAVDGARPDDRAGARARAAARPHPRRAAGAGAVADPALNDRPDACCCSRRACSADDA